MLLTAVILTCVVLFVFPYLIYPALLLVWPRRKAKTKTHPEITPDLPPVALVICALNEQSVIERKMKNCLELNYPPEKLRIIVVSDGSTDQTAAIVRQYQEQGVELIEREHRRGKIANLNVVLPACREDILVLSDANVFYHPDVLLHLVRRFRDPDIGCVSGRVVLTDSVETLDGATTEYYSMEWLLQDRSSEVYSMPGADGAMYAIRRELFRPCPDDTIIEDFVVPMQVVRQGKRVVFEPNAVGWERGVTSLREEFRRRIRIGAGSAQGLLRGNAWPGNAPLRFWFVFIGHKLLRWFSPVIGVILLLFCLASPGRPLSKAVLLSFAAMAVLAMLRIAAGWNHTLFSAPFYFLFSQVGLGIGLLKGFAGRQSVLWAKANR